MPNSNSLLSLPALLLAMTLSLLLPDPASSKLLEDTVAAVNGRPILLSEYKRNLESVLEQYRKNMPQALKEQGVTEEIRRKVLDQMVDDDLLKQKAEELSIKVRERELEAGVSEVRGKFQRDDSGRPVPPEEADAAFEGELRKEGLSVSQFRERVRRQLMVRKYVDQEIKAKVRVPTGEEIRSAFDRAKKVGKKEKAALEGVPEEERQAYEALAQRLVELTAESVRVQHVLVKIPPKAGVVEKSQALKKIQDIEKKIKAGMIFAEAARKFSEDPESAARGGRIGSILKGWMVPEFDKAAFALPVGGVSAAVETQFGYHLIRVQEKKAAEPWDFEEVKDQIAQFAANLSVQRELARLVKDLRSRATIEVNLPGVSP